MSTPLLGRSLLGVVGLGLVVACCLVLVVPPQLRVSKQPCACLSHDDGSGRALGHAAVNAAPSDQLLLEEEPYGATAGDVEWVRRQLLRLQVGDALKAENAWHQVRKGINPRTREQQLADLQRYKGVSHHEGGENKTALLCPGELLVEQHHSNYGEPWAGGRDVFEFLARATGLQPHHRVLELGCGTLRAGLHFIRHLRPRHYHCVERDALSLVAALQYELPAHGLLHKRPVILRSADLDMPDGLVVQPFDLIFASAVFLHVPDGLVWTGLERLGPTLSARGGRLFVSHNIKFCTRLPHGECRRRLARAGLEYLGKRTHDSLLFNHFEIWHEFRRVS